jgi:hypothetical protein
MNFIQRQLLLNLDQTNSKIDAAS